MWLANGLKFDVICCTGYELNNCTFYTKSLDDKSTVQNNGVNLEVESLQFSTSKDKKSCIWINHILWCNTRDLEVGYTMFTIALFKNVSRLTIRVVSNWMN